MLKGMCRITVISAPPLAPVRRMNLTESESKEHGQGKIILSSCLIVYPRFVLLFHVVKLKCGTEGTISWHLLKYCLSLCKGVVTGPSLSALDIKVLEYQKLQVD